MESDEMLSQEHLSEVEECEQIDFIFGWILLFSSEDVPACQSVSQLTTKTDWNFLVVPSQELAEQRNLTDWCQMVPLKETKVNVINPSSFYIPRGIFQS